jgi:hypothetical protein
MSIYSVAIGNAYKVVSGEIYKLVGIFGDQVNAINAEGNMVIHHIQDYLEDAVDFAESGSVEAPVESVSETPAVAETPVNVPEEAPVVEEKAPEDVPVAVDKETNNVAE